MRSWAILTPVSAWARKNDYPVTHLYLTAYFDNIVKYGQVKPNDDGTFTFGYAAPDDTVVPGLPVGQTGERVAAALSNPDKWLRECRAGGFMAS